MRNAEWGKNYFKITDEALRQVLAVALEKGGDYADLYFQHTMNNGLQLQDNIVNNAQSNVDFGVGVRVLKGDQTGYAYVENVSLKEMLAAARTAAQIADGGNSVSPAANMTDVGQKSSRYAISDPWESVSITAKIPFLQKLNDQIFAMDGRVQKVRAFLSDTTSHVFFCNSWICFNVICVNLLLLKYPISC